MERSCLSRERGVIDQLNVRLPAELNDRAYNLIHMTPPDIIDFQEVEKFRYVGPSLKKKKRAEAGYCFDELNLEDFLGRIEEDEPITLEMLDS